MKTGDIVRIPELGHDLHVIIGQSTKSGWWVQNLVTGALPTKLYNGFGARIINGEDVVTGWLPREMIKANIRHYDYAKLACHSAGTIHSDDSVTHYSGNGTPEQLCGYHALANTDWRISA